MPALASQPETAMTPEGDVRTEEKLLELEGEKNSGLLLQSILPDLDQITCRRSSRTPKPLVRAMKSND